MSYLLDTSVISEPLRAQPSARVIDWLQKVPEQEKFVSVLTVGEIRKGIELLELGARREKYRIWLEIMLPEALGERLLPISSGVADRWGRMLAELRRSVPIVDSLIAATALHHDLRLVTRNMRDFAGIPGLDVVNPWEG